MALFEILSVCKGGGYRYCRTSPPHPRANSKGLYPLHRVVAENKIGRLLRSWEIVHHVDEDKSNDAPENLDVISNSEHSRQHAVERAPSLVSYTCPVCSSERWLRPGEHRRRLKDSASGYIFCSRECSGRFNSRH